MKRHVLYSVVSLLFVILFLEGQKMTIRGTDEVPWKDKALHTEQQTEENLLMNGSMEDGFYWLPPNHFIANDWKRWWKGDLMPEYDDGHKAGAWDGRHSQRHHLWGSPTTGIFQKVPVTPCLQYQFSMYGRNSSSTINNHRARVGIDPLGRDLGPYMSTLAAEIVWSPDRTFMNTWGQHIVQAEARRDAITVITHISPENPGDYYDTYWDAGRLIALPFPDYRLPAPNSWEASDLISDVVVSQSLTTLTVEWETREPALTQIWYDVFTPTQSSGTLLLPAVYLPLLVNSSSGSPGPSFTWATPLDQDYVTHHEATITANLGNTVRFVILARRPVGDQCRTESSATYRIKMVKPTPPPPTQ